MSSAGITPTFERRSSSATAVAAGATAAVSLAVEPCILACRRDSTDSSGSPARAAANVTVFWQAKDNPTVMAGASVVRPRTYHRVRHINQVLHSNKTVNERER